MAVYGNSPPVATVFIINRIKTKDRKLPVFSSSLFFTLVQAPWARLGASAIRRHVAQMAVRSCAVGGATIPCVSNVSPSVSASSSGAALWSAMTVRTRQTFTPASPTSDLIGWT